MATDDGKGRVRLETLARLASTPQLWVTNYPWLGYYVEEDGIVHCYMSGRAQPGGHTTPTVVDMERRLRMVKKGLTMDAEVITHRIREIDEYFRRKREGSEE